MPIEDILKFIDQEISQLLRARTLLASEPNAETAGKRRGRPKGSTNKKQPASVPVAKKAADRTMSTEGKARIASAPAARGVKPKEAVATVKKTATVPPSVPAKRAARPAGKKVAAKKASAAKKDAAPSKAAAVTQPASAPTEAGEA